MFSQLYRKTLEIRPIMHRWITYLCYGALQNQYYVEEI